MVSIVYDINIIYYGQVTRNNSSMSISEVSRTSGQSGEGFMRRKTKEELDIGGKTSEIGQEIIRMIVFNGLNATRVFK